MIVSLTSSAVSLVIGMEILAVLLPEAIRTVPDGAVKSLPPVAVPVTVYLTSVLADALALPRV